MKKIVLFLIIIVFFIAGGILGYIYYKNSNGLHKISLQNSLTAPDGNSVNTNVNQQDRQVETQLNSLSKGNHN
jgi:uncharacterized protein YxeA